MKNQKYILPIAIIIVLALVAVVAFSFNSEKKMEDKESMENDAMMDKGDSMMEKETMVLAGTQAQLLEFSESEYQTALASEKLIVLYFYANWCPICKAEFPKMQDAFNELTSENVIGFRINYKDSETSEAEEELASEHGVAYQHTKVFIKNRERILKAPDSWSKDKYIEEINKLA